MNGSQGRCGCEEEAKARRDGTPRCDWTMASKGDTWGGGFAWESAPAPSACSLPGSTGGLLPPRQPPRRDSLEAPNHQGTFAFQRGNAALQLGTDVHTWTHYDMLCLDLNQ